MGDFGTSVVGFVADVGVSWLIESRFKGGGLGKRLFAGAAGGAGGGIAQEVVTNGFSVKSVGDGMLYGALGGAAGAGLGHYWGKRLVKADGAAGESLNAAEAAKKTADGELQAIDDAADALRTADSKLDDAARDLQRAENAVGPLQTRLDDAEAALRADPSNTFLQNEVSHARRQLEEAQRRVAAARDEVESATRARDDARQKHNDAEAKRGDAEDAARKSDEGHKQAEAVKKAAGKKIEDFGKWQRGLLVGLGSATFVAAHNLIPAWGADGFSGDPNTGQNQVTLVWDGYLPAVAAGVMGDSPFVQDPAPQEGKGFLLRPKKLHNEIALWYGGRSNSFASSLVDTHQMFGDLKNKQNLKVAPIPVMREIKDISTLSGGGSSYSKVSKSLDSTAKTLSDTQASVVKALATVEEVSRVGKENVGKLVLGVNRYMATYLRTGTDIEFVDVLRQGFAELVDELETAAEQNRNAANGIKQPSAAADRAAAQGLANSVGNYAGQMNNPALNPDSSKIGVNNPWDPGNLGKGDGYNPNTSDLKDSADKFRNQAEDMFGSANNPSNVDPASFNPNASQLGSTDPMGGMGGLMSTLLPMMMQQAAMRNMADSDLGGRMDDIDPSRFDQAAVPTLPQAQQPMGTTPWSNQAAANPVPTPPAQPVHHPTGAPSGATSNQPGAGVPKRVPGEDGLVLYVLPDGRTQRVLPAVAQGLDKAFANKSGTDAQAAYQGTVGAWAKSRDIGRGVDPFELATGDVGTWIIQQPKREQQKPELVPARADTGPEIQPAATVTVGGDTGEKEPPPTEKTDTGSSGDPEYRTALLVAFGEGESGTLEAVVNGELRQYEAEMSDNGGDFGEFAGFKRPKGLETAGDKSQDSETMSTSGDQTTADIPVLSAPV